MRSFQISHEQICSIICALTFAELGRALHHQAAFLSQERWAAEAKLSDLSIDAQQIRACAGRVWHFFGMATAPAIPTLSDSFEDWAKKIAVEVNHSLTRFNFHVQSDGFGAPEIRHVTHAADEIWQDARVVASLLHGRRRVVSLVSPHDLMGFVSTVLAPNLQNIPVVDARGKTPDVLFRLLSFGDLLVATPRLWRYLATVLPGFHTNIVGVTFGETLTLELFTALKKMGLGAMREFYGSTHTGLIAWRDSPAEPFVLFDHWSRHGAADILARTCPAGQAQHVTPLDFLTWVGARTFTVAGKRDGTTQIGTVDIDLVNVAQIIAEHESIEQCDVRVDQRDGQLARLIAHMILKPGVRPDEDTAWQVDIWCRARLCPNERPGIYHFEGGETGGHRTSTPPPGGAHPQ